MSTIKIPDGVYFIAQEKNGKTSYTPVTANAKIAPASTKYIGVKMDNHAIAVALRDIPGDQEGKLTLISSEKNRSPYSSKRYTYGMHCEKQVFDVYKDFDGEGNTEHLLGCGCEIPLPQGEWIPSFGQLAIMMRNFRRLNMALELAGGEPLKNRYWSSTQANYINSWSILFSKSLCKTYGIACLKAEKYAVRAVTAF